MHMASLKRRLIDTLTFPLHAQLIRKGSAWRQIEPEVLSRFLTSFRIDCVFDVGANIGQYATQLRRIGFRGLIISFEPNPDAASNLRKKAQADKRWIIQETALDSVSRTINFNVMKRSTFSSLHEPDHTATDFFNEMNSIDRKVSVVTQTIAGLLPKLQAEYKFTRPFLKMDTQGHDLDVTSGAGEAIRQFVGLQSELGFTSLYKDVPDALAALNYYRSLGFKLSSLVPNNAGHFPDLHEIDCILYNPAFLPEAA